MASTPIGHGAPDGYTDRIVTCKRCGATGLAWVKSDKTGTFYLVGTTYPAGLPDRGFAYFKRNIHKCNQLAQTR